MIQVTGTVAFDTVATVERLPDADETARVDTLAVLPGGAAGNVSLALARLGARVRLVAAVGRDFAGSDYERTLGEAGVDLDALTRLDAATAHAILASTAGGGPQHVYFHPGAAYALPAEPAARAPLGHFTAGPIDRYAARMRACDVVTFDPGQECFHREASHIDAVIPLVDVLFLNAHELARLTAASGWTVPRLLEAGPHTVVVTRGGDGQAVHTREAGETRVPAVPARVVEPTGAGDAHRAGFLHVLSLGGDAVTAARFGAVLASFAIGAVGPQDGLPGLEDAVSRYEKAFGPWPFKA